MANQLINGSFDSPPGGGPWYAPWELTVNSPAAGSLNQDPGVDGPVAARIDVTVADAASPWNIQLYQLGLSVVSGQSITISFRAKASASRLIWLAVGGTNYGQPAIALTTNWQTFSYSFTPDTTGAAYLSFNFAQTTGSVWLDGLSFGVTEPEVIVEQAGRVDATVTLAARLTATVAPTAPLPVIVLPPPTIYLGVTNHPAPWDMTALTAFEARAGRNAAIVSYFVGYQLNNPPETATLSAIRSRSAAPLITWEWQTNLAGNTNGLAETAAGAYDSDIDLWANTLKTHPGPVLLRWAHEMNGTWYPWSVGVNGNTAADYIAAFRRIVTRFRAAGATNVQFVWCPNIARFGGSDFTAMYPGDEYVDWLGLDGYNWGSLNPWQSFSQLFQSSYDAITALSNKPLLIVEWGCTEAGGNKGAWLQSALQTEIPTQFPRIKGVVYFNNTADGADWPIESSAGATAGYAAGAASSRYRDAWP